MLGKNISKKINEHNYRLTEQRTAVLEVMLDSKGQHLSAEEVLYKSRKKVPNIGIATVYRTLEKLAELKILYKTRFAGDKFRYELADDNEHQHHHMICLACGKISEVEKDLLHNLEQYLEEQGFKIVDHDLKFYGYCPECYKKI